VSRGPAEALGRLASEGLVTIRPRRGAVVTALSTQEFLAAYQVREALETLAIRLAVPRVGPDDLARLQALVDEMVVLADSSDVEAFFRANAAATFVEVSNAMLQDAMSRLLARWPLPQMVSVALRGSLRRSRSTRRFFAPCAQRRRRPSGFGEPSASRSAASRPPPTRRHRPPRADGTSAQFG
jgi:DNA-binding GntR family transcriptional regulator